MSSDRATFAAMLLRRIYRNRNDRSSDEKVIQQWRDAIPWNEVVRANDVANPPCFLPATWAPILPGSVLTCGRHAYEARSPENNNHHTNAPLSELIPNSPGILRFISTTGGAFWLTGFYGKKQGNHRSKACNTPCLYYCSGSQARLSFAFVTEHFIKRTSTKPKTPSWVFAFDNSVSMVSARDSSEIKGNFSKEFNALKKRFAKIPCKECTFGNASRESDAPPDFSDKETDIEGFRNAENNYSGANIGAIVMVTDGIYNRGSAPSDIVSKWGFRYILLPLAIPPGTAMPL